MLDSEIDGMVQDYQQFATSKGDVQKRFIMDKRNVILQITTPPGFDRTLLLRDAAEALHLPVLNRALLIGSIDVPDIDIARSLSQYLSDAPPHGHIIGDLPAVEVVQEVLSAYSDKSGMMLHSLVVESGRSQEDGTRDFFRKLAPICFEDPSLAGDYYDFLDTCKKLDIEPVLISGACSYIYWGRRALKDLDVLVPNLDKLQALALSRHLNVEHLVSSFADTQFLNFSHGVEAISDLVVLVKEDNGVRRIPFTYKDIMSDARKVRFLGEQCTLMSPEMTVLFKFALGRFGVDQWGQQKDDYEDARGVFVSQNINLGSLRRRAEQIGALDRVILGEKILQLGDK